MGLNIIVKGGKKSSYRDFYGPLDKGSAKPSFCYPRMKESLKEEIRAMEQTLDSGHIGKDKEMQYRATLKTKRDRLSAIDAQDAKAKELFSENKDAWMKRRDELAEEIAERLPTEKQVQKGRANPHRIYEAEKSGGFGEKKLEYQVISHLAEEESNTAHLQKEG